MQPPSIPGQLDLDSDPIHGQVANAVLDLKGHLVHDGQISTNDASILYKMLIETGSILLSGNTATTTTDDTRNNNDNNNNVKFQRLTVNFPTSRYVVTRDENYIYIVQVRIP